MMTQFTRKGEIPYRQRRSSFWKARYPGTYLVLHLLKIWAFNKQPLEETLLSNFFFSNGQKEGQGSTVELHRGVLLWCDNSSVVTDHSRQTATRFNGHLSFVVRKSKLSQKCSLYLPFLYGPFTPAIFSTIAWTLTFCVNDFCVHTCFVLYYF